MKEDYIYWARSTHVLEEELVRNFTRKMWKES